MSGEAVKLAGKNMRAEKSDNPKPKPMQESDLRVIGFLHCDRECRLDGRVGPKRIAALTYASRIDLMVIKK